MGDFFWSIFWQHVTFEQQFIHFYFPRILLGPSLGECEFLKSVESRPIRSRSSSRAGGMLKAKAAKQELAHVHPTTKIPVRQSGGGAEVSNGKHLRRISTNAASAAAAAKDLPDLPKSNVPKSRRRKKRDGGAATSSSESSVEPCRLEFVLLQ